MVCIRKRSKKILDNLIDHIKKNQLFEARNDLIEYGQEVGIINDCKNMDFSNQLFSNQLTDESKISNKEFIQIISEIFKNFDQINLLLNDYKKNYEQNSRGNERVNYTMDYLKKHLTDMKAAIDYCQETFYQNNPNSKIEMDRATTVSKDVVIKRDDLPDRF